MTHIETFLTQHKKQVAAARHWMEREAPDLNKRVRVQQWNDGPMPVIEKLIECVEILRDALEYVARGPRPPQDDSDTEVSKQALEKVEGILK